MSATLVASAAVATESSRARWAGRVLSGIAVLFLTFDAAVKIAGVKEAVESTVQLGWAPHLLPTIAAIQGALLFLYLVPRTAVLGAVLWTGYLGGAVASQLRVENPLFSHVLFPVYVAALLWGGLYLRDARLRAALGAAR